MYVFASYNHSCDYGLRRANLLTIIITYHANRVSFEQPTNYQCTRATATYLFFPRMKLCRDRNCAALTRTYDPTRQPRLPRCNALAVVAAAALTLALRSVADVADALAPALTLDW